MLTYNSEASDLNCTEDEGANGQDEENESVKVNVVNLCLVGLIVANSQ